MTHDNGLQNAIHQPLYREINLESERKELKFPWDESEDLEFQNREFHCSIHQMFSHEIRSIRWRFWRLLQLVGRHHELGNRSSERLYRVQMSRSIQTEVFGGDLDAMCDTLNSYRKKITSLREELESIEDSNRESTQSFAKFQESVASILWVKAKDEERRAIELAQLKNEMSQLSANHESQKTKLKEQDVLIQYYIQELRELELLSRGY